MEPLEPTGLETYLGTVLDQLLNDKVQLWELPQYVTALYYLGESCAWQIAKQELAQAITERNRYYRAACAGGFGTELKPHGLAYWELCIERGEHERAAQVKADLERLTFQLGGAL